MLIEVIQPVVDDEEHGFFPEEEGFCPGVSPSQMLSGICVYFQGCRKIDIWGVGLFIYSCSAQLFLLKSNIFTVCEHEYMNMCPQLSIFRRPCAFPGGIVFISQTGSVEMLDDKQTLRCHECSRLIEMLENCCVQLSVAGV